ncbi:Uma2 family endonuclease [Coleofasciculus sp. H7-2]|uniref:Uma2 family endonuclease n=1 Tax=Coleofasciculus sp. H7-2 TaxID=3351545 RepID=UPI00366CAF07
MQTQTQIRSYTPEEYLQLEETAEYKSEYRNGEIVPMTGGTTEHNEIAGNFYAYFKLAMRRQNSRIFMGDVRLWIPRYRVYTYPDIMVIQGEPVYEGTGTTTVTNPLMISEVLSKSTKNYDQVDKFDYYRSIPGFTEYILIDQYKLYVKQFAKNAEGKWVLTEYEGADSVLALASIEFQISFSNLYEGVKFNVTEEDSETNPTDAENPPEREE